MVFEMTAEEWKKVKEMEKRGQKKFGKLNMEVK